VHLDVPTLVAMGSFVSACAGAVLLIAWSQNPKTAALALWGLANIVNASGIASLMVAAVSGQPPWALLGVGLLALSPGLIWKAARSFDAKPAPSIFVFSGVAAVGLAGSFSGMHAVAGSMSLAIGAVYFFAAVLSLWKGRNERLKARWPVMILTFLHAAVLVIGLCSTLGGSLSPGAIPPLMSLFGLIHFEHIVFTFGTAVFILALVKERSEAVSEAAARIDPLTGIPNRSAFMENAGRVVEQCGRQNTPVSVVMCDLDCFKGINDTHGHAIGDAVIQKFSETATDALWPSDVLGRIGGEEFAIVLSGASAEAAYVRTERIRLCFAESCRIVEGHEVGATVSCGLSTSTNVENSLSELLRLSDLALYRAKAQGRNRVQRADQPKSDAKEPTVMRVA
jgi:diguanylate cyclase (GGDEF)-like protein